MTKRFTVDAQIDCLHRAITLVRQNPSRQRLSVVEYDLAVLTAAADTLAWLRANETAIRESIALMRGDQP